MQSVAERSGLRLPGVSSSKRTDDIITFAVDESERFVGMYDKRHLFRLAHEQDTYTAGTTRPVFRLNDFRIAPLICYDPVPGLESKKSGRL